MTQDQKRIAIAEVLGFSFEDKEIMYDGMPIKFRLWRDAAGESMGKQGPPDWFSDLNACHEMEAHLDELQGCIFSHKLFHLMNSEKGVSEFMKIHATPAQRAEAFGLTLSLWTP